jgi:branched-chain amino acid transport system substrate-binding protein
MMGSSVTPATLALIDAVAEARVPLIALAASSSIVLPMDPKRQWIFKPIQNESLMMDVTAAHMKQKGIKTVGYIGFSDSYGDSWLNVLQKSAEANGIKVTAMEKFSRSDTSVTAQILKVVATRPDAVFIAASGTPAALPPKSLNERGFKGTVYQTYGVANADFLRVAGKDADGSFFAVAPVMTVDELPDSAPMKKNALDFTRRYEEAHGAGTRSIFASNIWDGSLLVQRAVGIALKSAKPGTPEFRKAVRDALESTKDFVSTQGVFNMTPSDHVGYDERAAVMVEVRGGKWHLLK